MRDGRRRRRSRSRDAEDALQRKAVLYDKGGDRHYDTISAWIKSTRGSDPDASLLYLAAMLEGGEDPRFIARRMVDPRQRGHRQRRPAGARGGGRGGARGRARRACPSARSTSRRRRSTWRWRRSRTPSYKALERARARGCASTARRDPARHLRSAGYPRRGDSGRGEGYDYPHDRPEGVSEQELMPDEAAGERFLELTKHGRGRAARALRADPHGPRTRLTGRIEPHGSRRPARLAAEARRKLESFSPLDRRAARRRAATRARGGAGGRRRRRRGAAVLGAAPAGGPRALHAPRGAGDHRPPRRPRRAARARAGQAAQRGLRRWSCCRRSTRCTGSPTPGPQILADERIPHAAGFIKQKRLALLLRAARRRRRDRAVELPVVDPVRRGRDGADGRQRRGAQAGVAHAADRRSGSATCSSAPALPEGLVRTVHGGGAVGQRARRVERGEDLLHRLGRGRPRRRRRPAPSG